MTELKKKITTETLLEQIPAEKAWAITAKILTGITILIGSKTMVPLLGMGKGIIAPVWGWEKWEEIQEKTWGEGGKKYVPWVKETFGIPVEDAVEAAKLYIVVGTLVRGPELEAEIVEATPERTVVRTTKCAWWERYKEFEVNPEFAGCISGCPAWWGEGLKAINPKLTFKLTKAMPWKDSYCEAIFEFKEA